ncbi:hypothetical protein ACEQ38_07900 [Ralstonia syzygii subsp. celebesensis]|uniref:Uncharacterized protein n=3 Tax=Ralstonia syzygii TaxID=28097 RepID=A0A1U9VDS0_9RALS|nr:hypothetical protein [Ralstonia syzygii]AQW28819.1 hypothetical protein B0B51_01495 [blood disease bacterium A2-HR MARDI]QQV54631.1 hypothetical protein JK151_10640 [Ralstonia syzygii subsp. celebesensis]CCA79067.1 conserved hypothetical protein [blood disease bacterium R229]
MYTANPAPPRVSALRDYPYDELDDLLYDWALWERDSDSGVRGYRCANQLCGDARGSRQWQTTTEILERDVSAWQMQQIQVSVDELSSTHQLAIRVEAMNREGVRVWRNGRAPFRQRELYAEAKELVRPILIRRGVEIEC